MLSVYSCILVMQCSLFSLKLSIAMPQSMKQFYLCLDVTVASDYILLNNLVEFNLNMFEGAETVQINVFLERPS